VSITAPAASEIVDEFRHCAGAFTTGVTVVTACDGPVRAGMTLNSFTSLSLKPLLVCVALARKTRTLEILRRDGQFGISVLRAGQRDVARAFARPGAPFPDELTERFVDGYVLVSGALATLRCDLDKLIEVGDHELAIGRVLDFQHTPGEPLVFHRGEFGGLDRALSAMARRSRARRPR
jgi:3-hydroxy-9,10-secoandrosta-1,3,5(10)-triene-9,17-dione monooxygenase reductase component